ncbi:hypothetical protein FHG87_012801 [Trinorchestia longiramus]|nr:hypothetical protein FHG87_012801 [Trinorchestia longiramus]
MITIKKLRKSAIISSGLLSIAVGAILYSHVQSALSLYKSSETVEEENFKKFNLDPSLTPERVEAVRQVHKHLCQTLRGADQ